MIKTRTRLKYAALVPMFVVATFVAQLGNIQFASAATRTWDGSAGDYLFSTAANWTTNTVPVNGDTLNFDVSVTGDQGSGMITNDLTNLSIAGITQTGHSQYGGHSLLGNPFTLTGDIISNTTADFGRSGYFGINTGVTLGSNIILQNAGFYGNGHTVNTNGYSINTSGVCQNLSNLVGSGPVTVTGGDVDFANSPTYTGNIVVTGGTLYSSGAGLGTSAGTTTAQGTGSISLNVPVNSTWTEPFILSGSGSFAVQHARSSSCSGANPTNTLTQTFTGPVTLLSDFKFSGSDNMTITGTYNASGHTFAAIAGANGILTTPQGTSITPEEEITYTDSKPYESLDVGSKQTVTLNGTRGDVNVGIGGTLQGTGTAQNLSVAGGTIAPGNPLGIFTVLQSLTLNNSIYKAQLKSATLGDYDQLKVGSPSQVGQGAVTISGNSTLEVSLYDGYNIKQGDAFTIIDNLTPANLKVVGTFAGLAEGAQFTVNGIVFSITYVGGDGNDVVLTALNAGTDPNAPNTGAMQLIKGNPVLVAGLGIATAAIMIAIATRRRANR